MRNKFLGFFALPATLFFWHAFLFSESNAAVAPPDDSGRIIVKFHKITPRFLRQNTLNSFGVSTKEELRLSDSTVVLAPSLKKSEVIKGLNKSLWVEWAEEDSKAYALETPNDPQFSSQWGLSKIQAPGAWDASHGSANTSIAILDTGIKANHPDLLGKIRASVNCTTSSSCPSYTGTDPDGHGTHVAGIASAITNNAEGVAGISWEGGLLDVKVLSDYGTGYYSWIANGIYWAADNGAEVINLSLGGSSSSYALQNAVDYAWGKGVVVIAAAGNNGSSSRIYPAYYTNTISVAATDTFDQKANFSNYGSWVDVAAPGVSILSTYRSGYSYFSGTSMATPFVSGLAALVKGQHMSWTNSQVRGQIESTADPISGTGSYWTHGRINACRAVGCGEKLSLTATPPPPPSVSATITTTPTPTSTPTPTPTSAITPTPAVSATPSPTPTPSIQPKPWWCQYVPGHSTCQ